MQVRAFWEDFNTSYRGLKHVSLLGLNLSPFHLQKTSARQGASSGKFSHGFPELGVKVLWRRHIIMWMAGTLIVVS